MCFLPGTREMFFQTNTGMKRNLLGFRTLWIIRTETYRSCRTQCWQCSRWSFLYGPCCIRSGGCSCRTKGDNLSIFNTRECLRVSVAVSVRHARLLPQHTAALRCPTKWPLCSAPEPAVLQGRARRDNGKSASWKWRERFLKNNKQILSADKRRKYSWG